MNNASVFSCYSHFLRDLMPRSVNKLNLQQSKKKKLTTEKAHNFTIYKNKS